LGVGKNLLKKDQRFPVVDHILHFIGADFFCDGYSFGQCTEEHQKIENVDDAGTLHNNGLNRGRRRGGQTEDNNRTRMHRRTGAGSSFIRGDGSILRAGAGEAGGQ